MNLEALIKKLETIAKENKDQFRYHIGIKPLRDGSLEFSFVCQEDADGHDFIVGHGNTMEKALDDADSSIPEAREEWGYHK